jgi:hypothetical protein
MRRKPIIVIVCNFYRQSDAGKLLRMENVLSWMSKTNKNCVRIRRKDGDRAVVPYGPAPAWINLLTEADRNHLNIACRSFVDAMERRVKARLYPEDDWE